VVGSDAELRELVTRHRRSGEPLPTVGLLGGDLCRTVGGRGDRDRLRSDQARRLPIDVGSVLIDGRLYWFVAHLVARRSWWWGPIWAACNAQWIGTWDVAPRAHPGDGRLDTLDVRLSTGDRLAARKRLTTGTHVPHPDITQQRTKAIQVSFDRPLTVHLDGTKVGSARQLSVRVEPDALTIVI
jgi:diacylglycerol kinase family enzyme